MLNKQDLSTKELNSRLKNTGDKVRASQAEKRHAKGFMVGPNHEKTGAVRYISELFDKLLSKQYQNGKALEVATVLEIDAVIEPSETRKVVATALGE